MTTPEDVNLAEALTDRLAAALEVPIVGPNDARAYIEGQGWITAGPPGPLGPRRPGSPTAVTIRARIPLAKLALLVGLLETNQA